MNRLLVNSGVNIAVIYPQTLCVCSAIWLLMADPHRRRHLETVEALSAFYAAAAGQIGSRRFHRFLIKPRQHLVCA
jgi:hypothetical protein